MSAVPYRIGSIQVVTHAQYMQDVQRLINIARRLAEMNERCNSDLKPFEIGTVVSELDDFEKEMQI